RRLATRDSGSARRLARPPPAADRGRGRGGDPSREAAHPTHGLVSPGRSRLNRTILGNTRGVKSNNLANHRMSPEHPQQLLRQGREYRIGALSECGAALYEAKVGRRKDFWIRRADGSERPWNYRTLFGRKRPLEPELGQWEWLRE